MYNYQISYDGDIKLAKDILINLMAEQKQVFKDPAPWLFDS
jgi:small conductance mechanosensitive channel